MKQNSIQKIKLWKIIKQGKKVNKTKRSLQRLRETNNLLKRNNI